MKNTNVKTQKNVLIGMLCAVSFIAVLIGRLIPNVQGFLSYDPKDAVIVIAGFMFGPMTSVVISCIVSLVEMLTISSTGPYGLIMNIIATCAFACPAALYYKNHKTMKDAVVGLTMGVLAMTASMLLWNYIITPYYMGMPRESVAAMLPTIFLPFNLIKGGLNAGLTLLLYKPIVTALRKAHLLAEDSNGHKGHFSIGFTLFSALVLITFILLFLVFSGII